MKSAISPEPALLGFLRDGPLHGYELHKKVVSELGPIWRLGQSQMYAILNEYAERGWVRTHLETQGARPSKKTLELTPAGLAAFKQWLAQPARGLREMRVDFFARLYFARTLGRRALQRLIEQQLAETQREFEQLETIPAAELDPASLAFQVRDFRLAQLAATSDWLRAYQAGLDSQSRDQRRRTKQA